MLSVLGRDLGDLHEISCAAGEEIHPERKALTQDHVLAV